MSSWLWQRLLEPPLSVFVLCAVFGAGAVVNAGSSLVDAIRRPA